MRRMIIIIAVIILLAVFVIFTVSALNGSRDSLHTAVITVDGEVIRTVDLESASDETFMVESENGYNTVCIKDGEISVVEASCPDKICINHGALKTEYLPIVCLPNKLIIELK